MAEDMVYRVTRAICDNMNYSEAWPPCEYAGGVCPRCDAIMEGLGRGAIKAMREPTDEMLETALDVSGQRVAPFTAPRESGVATECDLSEEDAADINESLRAAHCETYVAMIDAALAAPKQPGAT